MERLKPGRNNPVGITTRSNHKRKRLRRAARVEETVWPHALVTRSRVGTRARTTRGAVPCVDWHIDNCSNKDAGTTVTSHEDRQEEEERDRGKKEEQHKNTRKGDNLGHIFNGTSKLQPEEEEPTKPAAHDRAGQAHRSEKKLVSRTCFDTPKAIDHSPLCKDQQRHTLGVGVGSSFWWLRLVLPSSSWD